jgi:hypothetical protein
MTWVEAEADGKIVKNLKWNAGITGRFGAAGVETVFPQVGLEYKVAKWFRPSVDYRFIIEKNKFGNYKVANRINANLDFKHAFDRLQLGLRLRYQYAFNRLSADAYDADFDQAIRVKPSFEYDLKGTKLSPVISAEFFYNPQYGQFTPGFTKMRVAAGIKYELKGPHTIGIKYQLDKKFRDYAADLRHVLNLSYSVSF